MPAEQGDDGARAKPVVRVRPIEKALFNRLIDAETTRRLIEEGTARGPAEHEAVELYVDWCEWLLDQYERLWDALEQSDEDPPSGLTRGSFERHPLPTRHDVAPELYPSVGGRAGRE